MNDSTALMETIDEKLLAKYVRFLVGSFRLGDAEDGEVLTRGLTALLGSYPEFVVRAVCDPRSGLPAKSKFFPTLYEVRSACEARMRPVLEDERLRRIRQANEADSPKKPDPEEAARRRAVVAEWRAKQALSDAVTAGVETPIADMDARGLHGEHKALVTKAINDKIARLSAESASTPMRLSDATLAKMGRCPSPSPQEPEIEARQ